MALHLGQTIPQHETLPPTAHETSAASPSQQHDRIITSAHPITDHRLAATPRPRNGGSNEEPAEDVEDDM
jgi:hypothetical protein